MTRPRSHPSSRPRSRHSPPHADGSRSHALRVPRDGSGAVLTSVKNPKVAAAVRLKKRAFRETDRRFLVEGAQGVGEALEHPGRLLSLFVSDRADPLAIRARQSGADVSEVSSDVMAKLTSTVTPQGIVGVCPFL